MSEWLFEVALLRSSAFYYGRGRVYRTCCRNVGVELAGVRNASPENDLLRGAVVEGQMAEAGFPIKESDTSAREPSLREHSTYNITENVTGSMCKRWPGRGSA